ncbi:MAG: hypothetical protein RR497_01400, partial [Oscillospiraceae bacterium]
STIIVFTLVDVFLNTLWLSFLMGTAYFPLLLTRIIPKAILMCAEIVILLGLTKLFALIEKDK